MAEVQEHVAIMDKTISGPVVARQDFPKKLFSVDFTEFDVGFFTDPVRVGPSGTRGEANRRWLHEKLDEFIEVILKEKTRG